MPVLHSARGGHKRGEGGRGRRHGNSVSAAVLFSRRLAIVVVTVAAAARLLGAEGGEGAGSFAQLGIELSLFRTLPNGAPARGPWGPRGPRRPRRRGPRLAQPGSFARGGRGGT